MSQNLSKIIFELYEYINKLEERISKLEKNLPKNSEKKISLKPPFHYRKK